MARVTVEDCVIKVPNRFELVLLAAQRAREITSGAPLSLDRDDDKNPVVALREIADETVGLPHLREAVVRGMQKHVELDEPEETHEIEVDPIVFGFAAVGAAAAEDAGIEARNFEDADISDEAELDEDLAIDDELDDDEDALEGELGEGELAADVLNVEDDDDADLGDLPESDVSESELPESELPESEPPESELPESDLPAEEEDEA